MRKKIGWIWVTGAIFLFISNFFTLGNQYFTTEKWAGIASFVIGFIVCPIFLFIGIRMIILGNKK